MSKELERHYRKESFLLYGGGFLLVLFGFILAYQFVEPAPPDTIRIATGNIQNAYYRFGTEYRQELSKQGVELEVLESAGSVENLKLLTSGQVDIAFVQGGIEAPSTSNLQTERHPNFQSLGSLYFEPLWIFHQKDMDLSLLSDLKNKRIAIGSGGSGTRPVALQLLKENGVSESNAQLLPIGGNDAATALKNNTVDVIMMVTSPKSPLIRQLIDNSSFKLFSFQRAEAYKRRHRYLSSVTLPMGVANLEQNIPSADVTLLAPTATLVVRDDFHPALAALILQAATKSHGDGGLFEQTGEFPSRRFVDYPLNEDAERFIRSGPPFLQRFLPFWAANLVDRLIVMLVPLVTLMIPLSKILPPTYRWRVRSRIYRWYDQLRSLDFKAEEIENRQQAIQLLEELIEIEKDVMRVVVPKSYADTQYNLRIHLRLIRERLERKIAQTK